MAWKGSVAKVCLFPAVKGGTAIVSRIVYLPMEGHGKKFPVSCFYRLRLAIHWAPEHLLFPGLASYSGHPFCPGENVKDLAIPPLRILSVSYRLRRRRWFWPGLTGHHISQPT